jgi:hypothetical protein
VVGWHSDTGRRSAVAASDCPAALRCVQGASGAWSHSSKPTLRLNLVFQVLLMLRSCSLRACRNIREEMSVHTRPPHSSEYLQSGPPVTQWFWPDGWPQRWPKLRCGLDIAMLCALYGAIWGLGQAQRGCCFYGLGFGFWVLDFGLVNCVLVFRQPRATRSWPGVSGSISMEPIVPARCLRPLHHHT